MIELIFKTIFGFYFMTIDGFFGSPNSLEGVIVIAIFALIPTVFTIGVPLVLLVSVALYHVAPVVIEILWHIERAVKAMRTVAPLWAWMVIGFTMYFIGMPFGDVGAPHYTTLVGSIFSMTFAAMMLAGIWAAKQDRKKLARYALIFFALLALSTILSVPLFSWAIAPGIGIMVAFFGLLGMTIQIVIEVRREPCCSCS